MEHLIGFSIVAALFLVIWELSTALVLGLKSADPTEVRRHLSACQLLGEVCGIVQGDSTFEFRLKEGSVSIHSMGSLLSGYYLCSNHNATYRIWRWSKLHREVSKRLKELNAEYQAKVDLSMAA
jgi:hypothetical protein